ncbi:hypothetical protein B296_00019431 [Ensete ventricosum]|uniref:Uncharacterized protein n=1 Tax=Ensete ventricosum TaxID=4639 RepID=A0A426ZMJ0_ENSVE|nr:hypothetical protein B296_00019431 [Ensete ventricosum]
MSLRHRGGAMVMEMLTTRRGSGFWRATGSGEEEVGARQAARSGEGWLRLRWLQREEDEEGTARGDCSGKGAVATMTEAQMHCGSRKQRRRYCAPTGMKELAVAAKQRRQRRSSGSGEEWKAVAHDGWQWRQVRSREEGVKQGRGVTVWVCTTEGCRRL